MACVLLVALWVRSFHFVDNFPFPMTDVRFVGAESNQGDVCLYTGYHERGYYGPQYGRDNPWDSRSDEVRSYHHKAQTMDDFRGAFGIGISWSPPLYLIAAPHLFCVLFAGGVAAAPWLRYRVSLRTLLIVMSLVAVLLGIIAAST